MSFPIVRRRSSRRSGRALALALPLTLALLTAVPSFSQARPAPAESLGSSGVSAAQAKARPSCDAIPQVGHWACMSSWERLQPVAPKRISAAGKASTAAAGAKVPKPKDGLTPADIRSAYKLPATGGKGFTIGIVDAYDNPKAESDLKVYRSAFKLPACTTANKCFRKVNQKGGTKYPVGDPGWGTEIALDIQAVSAACPRCKILLVEASTPSTRNLAAAVKTAVKLGADVVSNSYGGDESAPEFKAFASAYRYAKVPIVASSGDSGMSMASLPAALPSVWSVGGTVLRHTKAKGWTETAWRYGTSSCSTVVPKPRFQKDTLCSKRTVADVSAVAQGFAVYDTYGLGEDNGWVLVGGTSLSAPLLAAMMGRAGHPSKIADPAYAYKHAAHYKDITSGRNGYCVDGLCNAGPGYDAPTGIGAPRGLKGL
jgi:subtilase family serine protease